MTDVSPPPLPGPTDPARAGDPAAWATQARQAAPVPAGAPGGLQPALVDPADFPLPPVPMADGVARGKFASRKAAQRVVLEVDDVEYECSTTAPSDPLLAVVQAQESKDQIRLIEALRQFVPAVMYPEAQERYVARLQGPTAEGSAIDPTEFIAHGLWLVGVYFARPTVGSAPSGNGAPTQL